MNIVLLQMIIKIIYREKKKIKNNYKNLNYNKHQKRIKANKKGNNLKNKIKLL